LKTSSTRLLEAVKKLTHATLAARRKRIIGTQEAELLSTLAKMFKRQRKAFLTALDKKKDKWQVKEAAEEDDLDWKELWAEAAGEAYEDAKPLIAAIKKALAAAGKAQIATLGTDISFDLANPRAVEYMKKHGAELVTKINETSRDELGTLLSNSIDTGTSYDDLARSIGDLFDDFSRNRALTIARTELGNAYEYGNSLAVNQMQDAGLDMEKSWLTDGNADDECADNEDQGWIAYDDTFASGDDEPLAHPNCKCCAQYRTKQDSKDSSETDETD
jgi:hypothetical protein